MTDQLPVLNVVSEDVSKKKETSVALKLPGEEPPPSNYIPTNPEHLERKLARRFQDDGYIAQQLHTVSRRAGLRCSLRCEYEECILAVVTRFLLW